MSELFLIAHKVSGEAAFDVAIQIDCPECYERDADDVPYVMGCDECDQTGFWWIIPTSGHRAYPWWNINLGALMHDTAESFPLIEPERTLDIVPVMPPNLPDHYPTIASPTKPKLDLAALMKSAPIRRRA